MSVPSTLPPSEADSGFDAAVLGQGLPLVAEQALAQAADLRGDPPAAMAALMRARAAAPDHPAVLIAFYRHHFYGHRLGVARDVARQALVVGAAALGLPAVWRELPEVALAGARDHVPTRFYLWVLKGYAYLSLRLDDPVEARDALHKLRALDPQDHVGAALLEAVRLRQERRILRAATGLDDEADEDQGAALPVFGAQAWIQATDAHVAATAGAAS
jgi:hypothetical protein